MRNPLINKAFFVDNREALLSRLDDNSLAVINSSDEQHRNGDQYFPYRQNSDFFYLTGIEQEMSRLLICNNFPDKSYKEILFIRKPNPSLETWEGKKLSVDEARKISGIQNIKFLEDFDSIFRDVAMNNKKIYLNANEYPKFSNPVPDFDIRFTAQTKSKYPQHTYDRIAPLITQKRLIKAEEEKEIIKMACDITNKAFHRVMKTLKPGMSELDVEAEITYEFMKNGSRHHAYRPIIASGINACSLHYIKNEGICHDGDLLLMDFGAEYMNYASDVTRTIPVNGKFSRRQKECYNAVLRVQKETIKLFKPGTTIDAINKEVNLLMQEEMIKLGLFSKKDVAKQDPLNPIYQKYFMHGVSHFIGLDVHDVGTKYEELQPGMILTVEPGLYLKEENMGIRIENDVMITESGNVDLTEAVPREVDEIEGLMG